MEQKELKEKEKIPKRLNFVCWRRNKISRKRFRWGYLIHQNVDDSDPSIFFSSKLMLKTVFLIIFVYLDYESLPS